MDRDVITRALEALKCPGDLQRFAEGCFLHLYTATSSGRCPEKAAAGTAIHVLMLHVGADLGPFKWSVYAAQTFTRSASRWFAEQTHRLTPECVMAATQRVVTKLEQVALARNPTEIVRFAGKVANPRWPPENTDPCPVPRCTACHRPLFSQSHTCPKRRD